MATTIKKLTGMGGDVRKIAALLQKKAPPGHRLAYINDEEAALLKARGGSGKPHADTGIQSFEPEDTSYGGFDIQGGQDYQPVDSSGQEMTPQQVAAANRNLYYGGEIAPSGYSDVFVPTGRDVPARGQVPTGFGAQQIQDAYTAQTTAPGDISYAPRMPTGREAFELGQVAATPATPAAPEEKGMSKADKELYTRLGLAGALGLIGSRTASRAAAQGQAGKAEMQALAAPYQKQGAEIQAAAQRGELTPAGQQSLQAARAQAAQSAEARGGVGAAQAMQQVEAFRQQLLAQQYDYGLKLSGIGDNIALGAIKTGLQADQYVNQLNNAFYTNMAYIASGTSPGIRIGGQ